MALSFDSTAPWTNVTWINLATSFAGMGRDQDAVAAYLRAEAVDSGALFRNNINHEYGGALVRLGRFAEAESTFARMAGATTIGWRAAGLRSLGYLAVWRGRVEDGMMLFRQAAEATKQQRAPLSEARNRLLVAWSQRLLGRTASANAELDTVMTLIGAPAMEPRFLTITAIGLVRLGRLADADSVIRLLRSRVDTHNVYDEAAEALAVGHVQLARGRGDSALANARRAARYPQPVMRLSLEAAALRQLGRADSARLVLRELLDHHEFGAEGQEDWLHAHIVLGDLLLAAGDTAGARASYRGLVDRWREATQPLPDLTMARARLAALEPRRR